MKFNEALLKINLAVLKKYPSAQFYEAQGFLVPRNDESEVDGTIDTAQFRAIYNYIDEDRQKTIVGSFNGTLGIKVEVINDIWCEDVVMTPYVPMSAEDAIEMKNLTKNLVLALSHYAINCTQVRLNHVTLLEQFTACTQLRYIAEKLTRMLVNNT